MYFIHYNPPSILEAFHSHPFASLFTLAVWIMVMLFVWSSLSTESESRGDSIMELPRETNMMNAERLGFRQNGPSIGRKQDGCMCGAVFAPNRSTTRYCGDACKAEAIRRNNLERKRATKC